MSDFTDEETLPWIKRKLILAGLKAETNSDVYGSMHILASDHHGMNAYTRAYKCQHQQGVIANLMYATHVAIDKLEKFGLDASELKTILQDADRILLMSAPMSEPRKETE